MSGVAGELLLEYLRHHDAACPSCRYNVRAISQPRCPECGSPLGLKVTAPERLIRRWIGVILTLALPLGFALAGLLAWLSFTVRGFSLARGTWVAITIFAAMATANGGVLVLAIVRRHAFWRLPAPRQQRLMLAAVALAIVSTGVMFTAIMVRKSLG